MNNDAWQHHNVTFLTHASRSFFGPVFSKADLLSAAVKQEVAGIWSCFFTTGQRLFTRKKTEEDYIKICVCECRLQRDILTSVLSISCLMSRTEMKSTVLEMLDLWVIMNLDTTRAAFHWDRVDSSVFCIPRGSWPRFGCVFPPAWFRNSACNSSAITHAGVCWPEGTDLF